MYSRRNFSRGCRGKTKVNDNTNALPSAVTDGSVRDDSSADRVDGPVDFYYVRRGPSASVPLPDPDNYYVVHEMQWTDGHTRTFYILRTPDAAEASLMAALMRQQVVYLSTQQCADKYGLAASTWRAACAAGRITGATQRLPGCSRARDWYVPECSARQYAQRARTRARRSKEQESGSEKSHV